MVKLYKAGNKTLKVAFRANHLHQGILLPPDLNDLIATDHPVRVVNEVLESIDITELIRQYKPGGTSSYHPRMLLKVMVFGYMNHIYIVVVLKKRWAGKSTLCHLQG